MGIQINGNNDIISALDGSWTAEGASINTSGILTATTFKGNIVGTAATFTGPVTIGGTLTYEDVTNIDSVGIITARGDISIADKIVHTGDTDTAIRFPSNDNFTVELSGDEKFRIDGGQAKFKVGTNKTVKFYAPTHNDETNLGAGIGFSRVSDGAELLTGIFSHSNTGLGIAARDHVTILTGGTSNISDTEERVRITSGGRIGIGTDNPGSEIHIVADAPVLKVTPTNWQSGLRIDVLGLGNHASNNQLFRVQRDGTTKLQLNEDGDLVITGDDNAELKLKCGTSSGNAIIAFLNSSGSTQGNIFYDSDNNFMVFKTNGTASSNERLRITSTGRLGVGTNAPSFFTEIDASGVLGDVLKIKGSSTGQMVNIQNTGGSSIPSIVRFANHAGNAFWDVAYRNSNNDFVLDYNDSERFWFDASNGAYVRGTNHTNFEVRSGDASTKAFIQTVQGSDIRIGSSTDHPVNLYTNSLGRLHLHQDGWCLLHTTDLGNNKNAKELVVAFNNDGVGGGDQGRAGITIRSGQNTSSVSQPGYLYFSDGTAGSNEGIGGITYDHADDDMFFTTGGYQRLRIDSSGNIGQAVTPSAWSSAQANDFFAYQVGSGTALFGRGSGDEDRGGISANLYCTASAWKYIANGNAGRIYFEDGSIVFNTCDSGTAGATATLHERLKITSGGLLLLGTNSTGFSSGYTNMTIGNTSTQNTGLTIASSASNGYGRIHFADANSGNAVYAGWIAYDHANDSLIMSTDNSGSTKLELDSDGKLKIGNNFNSNSNGFKMSIKETSDENAAILFLDTDNMRGGYCGISKGTNQIMTGDGNVDFIVGSTYANTHIISGNTGGGSTGSIKATFDTDGHFKNNNVKTFRWGGYIACSASVSVNLPYSSQGNIYHIKCMFTHYNQNYGAYRVSDLWVYNGHSGIQQETVRENFDSSNGGAWTITRGGSSSDPIVVAKSAGTYSGYGHWWIEATAGWQ